MLANILPVCLTWFLAVTYRTFPFPNLPYGLITLFPTVRTILAHYTYAQVPVWYWVEPALALSRNPFDRVVHFSFGILLTYPLFEVLIRFLRLSGFVSYDLSVMAPLGLSGLWKIMESWVAHTVTPPHIRTVGAMDDGSGVIRAVESVRCQGHLGRRRNEDPVSA